MIESWERGDRLYSGKAKDVYAVVGQPNLVWLDFKDSLTAFNGAKTGAFSGKGAINRDITSALFRHLTAEGIRTHWRADIGDHEMVVERMKMIPLEVVVRNRLAGSTAKKFQREEGEMIKEPLVEFYYKDDGLGDPFINDEQALYLGAARNREELSELKAVALEINRHLKLYFSLRGIDLVDFKLEFGHDTGGELILGDEISPDSCRLWDIKTGERMDKDRFRRDLGGVEDNYREIHRRVQSLEKWS